MNDSKLDLKAITGKELLSLENKEVGVMYELLYGAGENEVIRSPYEVDRDKTVFRTRQMILVSPKSDGKGNHEYKLTATEDNKKNVMDLASKMFLHDTFPSISVKEEFRENTQICHCRYPGHVKIEEAHLYHGSQLAGSLDNITLDQYAQFSIPMEKRDFYRKMVGDTEKNTSWSTDLPSFTISVPQPWYFCTIPGAELRLNSKTPTTATYVYREEATSTLRMRIKDDNDQWLEVDPEEYIERLTIGTVGKKKATLELYMVTHKCHTRYISQLEEANIVVPYEDVVILDSVRDENIHEVKIDAIDFVRKICILAEPKKLTNKSVYEDAIVSGKLEYGSSYKKIPNITPYQLLFDDIWSSSYALPDRENFYMLTFSDHNRPGSYDTSISLGGLSTKMTLNLKKADTYDLRIRIYVYRLAAYENNTVSIISSMNAPDYIQGE